MTPCYRKERNLSVQKTGERGFGGIVLDMGEG